MNLPSLPTGGASILQDRSNRDGPSTPPDRLLAIAIGIVVFNNPPGEIEDLARTLHRALDRLAESEARANPKRAIAFSIRLQNNGDTRVDPDMFGPHALLINSPANTGFGSAHNRMMREAFDGGAGYYLALNPDGMLHPDALVELLAVARRNENRALVEAAQFPEELPKVFDPLTLDTPWATGCCLLIPSAIYAVIGGFDENMFLYCEDVDLSWRARNAGFAVKHAPAALICHVWHLAGVNHVTKRAHLDAARYLSKKWRDEASVRKIEGDMIALGWQPKPLPPSLPAVGDISVADFTHALSYASERWICPGPIPTHSVAAHADIDNTIDVIVRFHDPAQVRRLSRCLFSLYGQRHRNIQVLLMLQGLDQSGVAGVEACVDAFDWSPPRRRPIVTNIAVAPGGDHRARLWNAGIETGRSRYLGFCDFDDLVYAAGYSYLLHRLQFTGAAAVFASSLHVDCTPVRGFDYIFAKRFLPGKDRYDFFFKNFCPPNSVLFDRSQIRPEDFLADVTLSKHEDYRVFAVIVSRYKTDWASVGTAVAEYLHRTDGSNTVMSHRRDGASWQEWGGTAARTLQFFDTLTTEVPVNDLIRMRGAEKKLEALEAEYAQVKHSWSWRLAHFFRSGWLQHLQRRSRNGSIPPPPR